MPHVDCRLTFMKHKIKNNGCLVRSDYDSNILKRQRDSET